MCGGGVLLFWGLLFLVFNIRPSVRPSIPKRSAEKVFSQIHLNPAKSHVYHALFIESICSLVPRPPSVVSRSLNPALAFNVQIQLHGSPNKFKMTVVIIQVIDASKNVCIRLLGPDELL